LQPEPPGGIRCNAFAMGRAIAALLALVVLAVAPAAEAKGPTRATIEGPGLSKSLAWNPVNAEKRTPGFFKLVAGLGFFPAAFGTVPSPLLPSRPEGDLGPKYTITYGVPTGRGKPAAVRQDLYPYAAGGPVTYMPPGQKLFVDRETTGGWYRAGNKVKATLRRLGLPATPPSQDSGNRNAAAIGGALLVGILGALGVATLRRRPRPKPA
jgi:hypothetical protein